MLATDLYINGYVDGLEIQLNVDFADLKVVDI